MLWILVAALAAPALLLVAEASCRWWIRVRSRYYVWPPQARLEIRPDPEAFPELDRHARFHFNADGERGGEVAPGEDGQYRILSVVANSVEVFELYQPTTRPRSLAHMLNAP